MSKSSYLTVDLSRIYHNLKALAASNSVMVMVKGNAYGTDPLRLSQFIQKMDTPNIPFLGVSHVGEGIYLRTSGIELPIFVISAPPDAAESIIRYRLTPAVGSFEEVEALNAAAEQHSLQLPVHLFLNTGMNRFGISLENGTQLFKQIESSGNVYVEGVMTHFAAADEEAFDAYTHRQIAAFKHFVEALPSRPKWVHAANSAGAARFSLPFCNLSRIGLATVGYGPCQSTLKPALTLTTLLSSITSCRKGETVGYGRAFTMKRDAGRVGVIPFGYYDGYPRSLSGKGYVLIHGKKVPMIGTVCMDFTLLDLTDIPEAKVGDTVTLFDTDRVTPETLAKWSQTDVREILVRLSARTEQLWINPLILEKENDDKDTSPERLRNPLLSI